MNHYFQNDLYNTGTVKDLYREAELWFLSGWYDSQVDMIAWLQMEKWLNDSLRKTYPHTPTHQSIDAIASIKVIFLHSDSGCKFNYPSCSKCSNYED